MMSNDAHLRRLLERALERGLEDVLSFLKLFARGRRALLGGEEVGRGGRIAFGPKALLDQDRLDPSLVQGVERAGETGDSAGVSPELAAQAVEPGPLPRSFVALDDGRRFFRHL